MTQSSAYADDAYHIPPDVYDVAVSWDPTPEVNRLVHLARQTGAQTNTILELGCATGRLLAPLTSIASDVAGLEINPAFAEYARRRTGANVALGDMTSFDLGRRFDLIFTSANTIRHALTNDRIASMWRCIERHLSPGGVFVADLELGLDYAAAQVHHPVEWEMSRDDMTVHVSWLLKSTPTPESNCSDVEYAFQSTCKRPGRWCATFKLRTYDAGDFLRRASSTGNLRSAGLYENREPYLLDTLPEKAAGRFLAAFKKV